MPHAGSTTVSAGVGLERVAGVDGAVAGGLGDAVQHHVHRGQPGGVVDQLVAGGGPTEDTQLLVARLSANPPGLDLALTDVEEAAYTGTIDRMKAMWVHALELTRFRC